MIYPYIRNPYITKQWDKLRDTAVKLQGNINEALDSGSYITEEEEQELRHMRRACSNVLAALFGYVD